MPLPCVSTALASFKDSGFGLLRQWLSLRRCSTDGAARVAGYDIRTDMDQIYRCMGVCVATAFFLPMLWTHPLPASPIECIDQHSSGEVAANNGAVFGLVTGLPAAQPAMGDADGPRARHILRPAEGVAWPSHTLPPAVTACDTSSLARFAY